MHDGWTSVVGGGWERAPDEHTSTRGKATQHFQSLCPMCDVRSVLSAIRAPMRTHDSRGCCSRRPHTHTGSLRLSLLPCALANTQQPIVKSSVTPGTTAQHRGPCPLLACPARDVESSVPPHATNAHAHTSSTSQHASLGWLTSFDKCSPVTGKGLSPSTV